MTITIYHNPHCSKSRQALALLEEKGKAPKVIHYLEDPPTEDELKRILRLLGLNARELMRKKEAAYKELGLGDPGLTETAFVRAMVGNPILIERPIVINGERAAIGRPPEQVLEIV